MDEYLIWVAFDRGNYIPQEHIKKVTYYICGQLILGRLIVHIFKLNTIMRLN